MAFERNDIVVKTKLADALGETLMGFEHNDIVTTDVMNAAIAGGGGGGDIGKEITVGLVSTDPAGSYDIAGMEYDEGTGGNVIFALVGLASGKWTNELYVAGETDQSVTCALIESAVNIYVTGGVLTVSGAAEITYQEEGQYYVSVTGDCTLTLAASE